MEDRPVTRFQAPVITGYIREVQDKSIGGEGSHGLLPDLEALDREWSQGGSQSSNYHGRKICLGTNVCFKMEGQSGPTPGHGCSNVPGQDRQI